jgi:hypothetical protein
MRVKTMWRPSGVKRASSSQPRVPSPVSPQHACAREGKLKRYAPASIDRTGVSDAGRGHVGRRVTRGAASTWLPTVLNCASRNVRYGCVMKPEICPTPVAPLATPWPTRWVNAPVPPRSWIGPVLVELS